MQARNAVAAQCWFIGQLIVAASLLVNSAMTLEKCIVVTPFKTVVTCGAANGVSN